jgi:hypothetical protein
MPINAVIMKSNFPCGLLKKQVLALNALEQALQ